MTTNIGLYVKAHLCKSTFAAVELADRTLNPKHIKFAESILSIKNNSSEVVLNKKITYEDREIPRSEKYQLLREKLESAKERIHLLEEINSGNIEKIVHPNVHSMMLSQSLNHRITEEYPQNLELVREIKVINCEISQRVMVKNSWDEVRKFESFSNDIHKLIDEKTAIEEIKQKTILFKNQM